MTLVAAPAVIAIVGKLILPRRPMLIPGRAAVLMVVTLALAPGLLTNILLKSHWGRPRPIDVVEFGGDQHFVPWWDPRGDCPTNCSFVAGEPSGAFWTLAPAALVPPAWRALAYAGALAFGAGIGLLRMAGGGHFFTDVAFSGLFTFLIIWLVHALLFRSPGTSDRAIERALEWLVLPLHRFAAAAAAPAGAADPSAGCPGGARPRRRSPGRDAARRADEQIVSLGSGLGIEWRNRGAAKPRRVARWRETRHCSACCSSRSGCWATPDNSSP